MLDDYLKGIFKTATQADATEPSHYPVLKDLLEAFAEESGLSKVQVTGQPKNTWRVSPGCVNNLCQETWSRRCCAS